MTHEEEREIWLNELVSVGLISIQWVMLQAGGSNVSNAGPLTPLFLITALLKKKKMPPKP